MIYFVAFVFMYIFIGLMWVVGNYYMLRRKFVKQLDPNDTDDLLRFKYERAFYIYGKYLSNSELIFGWPKCILKILEVQFQKREEKFIQKIHKEKFPESTL